MSHFAARSNDLGDGVAFDFGEALAPSLMHVTQRVLIEPKLMQDGGVDVAEVHGIPVDQREYRRALVLEVLVGEDSKRAVRDLVGPGRTSGAWIGESTASLPMPVVTQLNNRLLRYFVKRYTLKRGVIAFGKVLPMGVGAAIGGGGNRLMAKKIIGNARKAFGPAPSRWPRALHLLPPASMSQ